MGKSFVSYKLERKICSREAIAHILKANVEWGRSKLISFVNPFSYSIVASSHDLIEGVDYWFCDGALMCLLTNIRRSRAIVRASFDFSSIAHDVFGFCESESKRIAFVGAGRDEIDLAVRNINLVYKKLKVVYVRDGFINEREYGDVCSEINNAGAEVLIVGMGTPLQEKFSIFCKKNCSLNLIFTCGGFLTQTAIKSDYYHPWVKSLGLRWLQRAIMHPHVRSRLVKDYPLFVCRYLLNR